MKELFTIKNSVCAIPVLVCLLLAFYFGFYYELYEPISVHIASASFCDPPYHLWVTTVHLFLFPVYAVLYHLLPSVDVVGIFEIFLSFCSLIIIDYFLYGFIRKNNTPLLIQISLVALIDIVLIQDTLIQLNATRLSVLLTLGPMLLLLYDDDIKPRKWGQYILYAFALAGCMMRLQSAVTTIVFTYIFSFFAYSLIKPAIGRAAPVVLISILLALVYTADRAGTSTPAKKIENQYEYAILDRHQFVDMSEMRTPEDSIRYLAVTNFMLNDSAVLMTGFVDKVLDPHWYSAHPEHIKTRIEETKAILSDFAWQHRDKLIFIFLLACISIAVGASKLKLLSAHLAISLTLWIALAFITFYINMFDRVFATSLVIAGLFHFMIFIRSVPRSTAGIIIMLLVLPLTWIHLNDIHRDSEGFHTKYKALSAQLYSKPQKYVLCMGINSLIFDNKVPVRRDTALMSRFILPDFCYINYYSFCRDKYKREDRFDVTDFASIADFIKRERSNIIIYGNPVRVEILSQYLRTIHHINLTFKKSGDAESLAPDDLYCFYEVDDH